VLIMADARCPREKAFNFCRASIFDEHTVKYLLRFDSLVEAIRRPIISVSKGDRSVRTVMYVLWP